MRYIFTNMWPCQCTPIPQRQYRGSDEEQRDVLQQYTSCSGDMNRVFDWVMCSRPEVDSHRFMDMIDTAIEKGG